MNKPNFIFTPQMLIAASDMDKDFENLVTYLEFKGGQYLFESGELYDEDDDPVYEAMTHLYPFASSYESTLASVIKMLNAIGFWREYVRTGETRLTSNYTAAITAYALEANDMAHEMTTEQVESYVNELACIQERRKSLADKSRTEALKSDRSQLKREKEKLVLLEYDRLKRDRPGEERSYASLIAKKVGYRDANNVRTILRRIKKSGS